MKTPARRTRIAGAGRRGGRRALGVSLVGVSLLVLAGAARAQFAASLGIDSINRYRGTGTDDVGPVLRASAMGDTAFGGYGGIAGLWGTRDAGLASADAMVGWSGRLQSLPGLAGLSPQWAWQGQISAWAPSVDGTHAFTIVDDSTAGDSFTGLAIGTVAGGNLLYAADFAHGTVVTLDSTFAPATTTGGFVDATLPTGYAPFGIQQIGGKVFVTYALRDTTTGRDTAGAGLGLVDVFDLQGTLLQHLVGTGGALNAPWGVALAPSTFRKYANMLLVGNFGDGTINVYDPTSGAMQGTLSNNDGTAIVVPGLWALQFGNDLNSQPSDTLFYTAGPGAEAHGLYGRIDKN
ncbi:MAG: TIGR03118 family protein [Caulobacter sp.]|nr:TIGR03118 family protein [Vitreoscilla sp.]